MTIDKFIKILHGQHFLHRIGNTLQSLVSIAENLVVILTFSYYIPNWTMKFIIWRIHNKYLYYCNNQ